MRVRPLSAIAMAASLGILALEAGLALFAPQASAERLAAQLRSLFVADDSAVYRHAEHASLRLRSADFDTQVTTVELGLRFTGSVDRPGVRKRVLCLGDSFTFGYGVSDDEAFPSLLNRDDIASFNAGVAGYGTDNELHWLDAHGWGLRPDVVLLGFFVGNDVRDVMLGQDKTVVGPDGRLLAAADLNQGTPGALPTLRRWMAEQSHSYVFARRLFRELWPRAPAAGNVYDAVLGFYDTAMPADIADGWVKTFALLDQIADGAARHQAKLVVVAIPAKEQVDDLAWLQFKREANVPDVRLDRERPQRELAGWARARGVPVLDLLPGLRAASDGPLYFERDGHWNAAGHALAARLVRAAMTAEPDGPLRMRMP